MDILAVGTVSLEEDAYGLCQDIIVRDFGGNAKFQKRSHHAI